MTQVIAPVLGEATVQELRETVRGEILTSSDEGYADACRIWNGAHDGRRPALVARCTGAADVIAAVGFARSNHLPVAVRGGGHSVAGFSTCDGGLVIDLSPMNGVRVDPEARRATVGGGAVWADVDHETQAYGLATTGGLVSSTGIGGFTLGGGIGWLMRLHGLACDNLVAADVVTADGRLVHANEAENADLFWGLRGGGGNFGIVTQFEFELHAVGPMVYAGPIFYAADAARDLLHAFRDWARDAPDEITALVVAHDGAAAAGDPGGVARREGGGIHRRFGRPARDGGVTGRRLRAVAEPIADLLGPMPYQVIQTLIDPLWGKGINSYFKATNLSGLDGALIDRLTELHLAAPGPQCEIHVHQMGGEVARVTDDATAFAERSMPFVLNAATGWHDAEAGSSHREWARGVIAAAEDVSTGRAYINFLGDADAARSSYGDQTYARLVALKNEHDPSNVFRLNQNIEPQAGGA